MRFVSIFLATLTYCGSALAGWEVNEETRRHPFEINYEDDSRDQLRSQLTLRTALHNPTLARLEFSQECIRGYFCSRKKVERLVSDTYLDLDHFLRYQNQDAVILSILRSKFGQEPTENVLRNVRDWISRRLTERMVVRANNVQRVTKSILSVTAINITRDENCPICLSEFNNAVSVPCGHEYCNDCIKHWHDQDQDTCPLCRKSLSGSDQKTSVPQAISGQESSARQFILPSLSSVAAAPPFRGSSAR